MHKTKHGLQSPAQEGAKNPRVKHDIYIGTYNVRTLLGDGRLTELKEELKYVKWDIIGLAETKRRGEGILKLENGNILYTVGKADSSHAGVGFLIHKEIANNVIEYKSSFERVAMIVLQLNNMYKVKIVQVYAPTSTYDDEAIEDMYEEINKLLDSTN